LSTIDPSLSNRDLAPTTPAQRTWTTYNYIALWFSMSMEITTYKLASSLIAKGMDWKQALATVLLGNLIVLIPMLLNAHAGTKYGIPFPVFIRAPFGVRGANLPAVMRAIVACGWFGIQSWIGGTAIHSMLVVIWPSVAGIGWLLWACFLGFWLLNMIIVWRGVESIRHLQAFGAPFMFVMASRAHCMGTHEGGKLRLDAFHAQPVPFHPRIPRCLLPIPHCHGWLLGDARAEHSRFHTFSPNPNRRKPGDRHLGFLLP
jgi:NCS1 family nucleobase:cation symporter-1